jgi:hypothetical protein
MAEAVIVGRGGQRIPLGELEELRVADLLNARLDAIAAEQDLDVEEPCS